MKGSEYKKRIPLLKMSREKYKKELGWILFRNCNRHNWQYRVHVLISEIARLKKENEKLKEAQDGRRQYSAINMQY